MRVLVTGASGFVGSRLVPALQGAGHEVLAMTRRPERYLGPANAVGADVADPGAVRGALHGCEAAYYLIHSLDRRDFVRRDAAAAREFGEAAADTGVRRIVYLGGLGDPRDELSRHLRSRQEVEELLGAGGVPVTTVRAGIVIGHGGASWEMTRAIVARVPALLVPRWAMTRTQPIAIADVVRYLVGVLSLDERGSAVYQAGGPDILRYVDMIARTAAVEGRPALVVPVPVPSVRLASALAARALPLLAGVDGRTVSSLLESMGNEVVVRDDALREAVPFEPMSFDEAVRAALDERRAARRAS